MTITQTFSHATLVLDFDAFRLQLTVPDDPSLEVDVTSDSLAAMNDVYQAHVLPYVLGLPDAFVMEEGGPLDPPADLEVYLREEQACRAGPPPEGQTRVDSDMIALTWVLRERLNRGLGPDPVVLHDVVFYLNDSGIAGVYVNPPGIAGVAEDRLVKAVKSLTWLGRDCRDRAAWSLEWNPVGDSLEAWGDPSNLYDSVVTGALYLACARLEADPALRANASIAPGFRVFFVFHDQESHVNPKSRALAARHVTGPASVFFDVWHE